MTTKSKRRVRLKGRKRAPANRMTFTDLGIKRMRPPKEGQRLFWDKGQRGLALLVSAGGTRTFRSQYRLHGKWCTRSIGRFGEVVADEDEKRKENASVSWARERVRTDRALAAEGIDPKAEAKASAQPPSELTYSEVVDMFIEQYAKRRQRTWAQTRRALRGTKAEQRDRTGIAAWLDRPMNGIQKNEAITLLENMEAAGLSGKSRITRAWLDKLWKWALRRDLTTNAVMEFDMDTVPAAKKKKKFFSEAEIKASWEAAGKLDSVSSAYVRLLILLAPRKDELAAMRRQDLDDPVKPAIWTTPPEQVKQTLLAEQKEDARVYVTPLPPLAQRILSRVLRSHNSPMVFPSAVKLGVPISPTGPLTKKLKAAGAPASFEYHAWRHTAATWLQNQGHDKFDRGLLLNHSESGVTARYSHGFPTAKKLDLLTKWSDHVEGLVSPGGTALYG